MSRPGFSARARRARTAALEQRRRRGRPTRARLATRLAFVCVLLLVGVVALTGVLPGHASVAPAVAQSSQPPVVPQTDDSVPASSVTMIGATPLEAPGTNETWGIGESGSTTVIVRYTKEASEAGWTLAQTLPTGFALAKGPLAGQMTPSGVGALVGSEKSAGGGRTVLLVRKPHGAFEPALPVSREGETLAAGEEPLLKEGEELSTSTRAPMFAPLDESGGQPGVLIAPVHLGTNAAVESQVLHWDGAKWSSEPVEIPAKSAGNFRILAIGASDPQNAWLLGQLAPKAGYPVGAVALFRRVGEGEGSSEKWSWKPVTAPGGTPGEVEPLTVPVTGGLKGEPFTVPGAGQPPTVTSQLLTVTSEGLWIDGQRDDVTSLTPATTTLFFKPAGTTTGGVAASWCLLPAGVPAETPQCQRELPEPLPKGSSRSIAWANGSEFGERVITGFPEGVSLRLGGEGLFERVLALGSGSGEQEDPGATHGAAFTSPAEGWLGSDVMPVHLTREPVASRLTPWPTAFRHPLLAITPQPGVPVGSLFSEALAVGDQGAVARYKPGVGWQPESLFGVGQRIEKPRLRAVAWPTPSRAYAVGDYASEYPNMWLWRGETGLWEPDPAMPLNFRGNLLGVAFDPANPARGYAVGSNVIAGPGAEGILLRYGKTWTQETVLPAQVKGASFISIAFAGSEAIVAYRRRLSTGTDRASGGLLVNDGSGWQVDEQAGSLIGEAVPDAVAGLPDGGAAFTTIGGPGGPRVYERESAGSPWQATPVPLPGLGAGSLTVFREGDALRAIVSAGGVANEGEPAEPPPGLPPNALPPFPPVGGGPQSGGILRQTANGWRDESHELNPAREQPGDYADHDLPYRPDPILAVMVDPSGSQGWAVGGNISSLDAERLETSDVERYPAEGTAPLGLATSPIPKERPEHESNQKPDVTFAIGGGAQCSAPCADRALAGVGPDVWLTNALARARQVEGVRAFLYTGPYVTAGDVNGPRSLPIPFSRELAQYASILGSAAPLPVYAAIAPTELNARPEREGTEQGFEEALAPFGFFGSQASMSTAQRQECVRRQSCEADYYAFDSTGAGGTVRVIVLDDSADVESTQLTWLEQELEGAKRHAETTKEPLPAIVIGNSDLDAQVAAGDEQATRVITALVTGSTHCQEKHETCGASAYFYNAPEENVKKPLRADGESIEEIGSGTLGYVSVDGERYSNFHGASGFLLGQVEMDEYEESSNRAPVTPRLIPNISELALEAHGGTLLRRSSTALFAGLARRPRAGGRATANSEQTEVDPYIPIPEYCVGAGCGSDLLPEYTFSSSSPDIGGFVKPNLALPGNHEAVLINAHGEPEHEPVNESTNVEESTSGLFCAYNAGKTTVTISAGGLSASLPVTVEAGSVREPCGTVHLKQLPAAQQRASAPAPPPPSPAPAAAQPAPAGAAPPIPLPPPPVLPAARPNPPHPSIPPFVPLAVVSTPLLAFVPPPVPTPARPSPPTGTSAVTSPIEVAEREDEEESATEQASNLAVAYRAGEDEPASVYLLGVLLLAALAGASIRRPRRGRRPARVAPATVSSARTQRRLSEWSRRR